MIVLTPSNQSNTAPWCTVEDLTFQYNTIRNGPSGCYIIGRDNAGQVTQPAARLLISHNIFHDIDGTLWDGNGRLFYINGAATAPQAVQYEHNTALVMGSTAATALSLLFSAGGSLVDLPALSYRNNIVGYGAGGIRGDGVGTSGNSAIAAYNTQGTFTPNGMVDINGQFGAGWPPTAFYPSGTLFAASLSAVGFVDQPNDNYQLTPSSPFARQASDGTDLGVNFVAFSAAQ